MPKKFLKGLARRLGYDVRHIERSRPHGPWGVDLALDVERLHEKPIDTVFDVGAHAGETATDLHHRFPAATIHSFEPVQATYERLQTATRDLPRVKTHRLALSSESGEREIRIFSGTTNASLSDVEFPGGEIARETIHTQTLDAFCAEQGIKRINLLKIDTEGFDIDVLIGAKDMLAAGNIDMVYSEFFCVDPSEPQDGTALLDLHEMLFPHGFQLVAIYIDRMKREGDFFALRNALFYRWVH